MSKEKAEKSNMKSADDLIVKSEQERLGKIMPEIPVTKPEEKKAESESPVAEDKSPPAPEEKSDAPAESEEKEADIQEQPAEEPEDKPIEDSHEGDVDDYGTKVGKKKLYTEEEVQGMIRKRLKLSKQGDQTQQQAVQQAAKDFTPDPESGESWETQLESFVERTVQKMTQKRAEAEWRQREEESQAEFEIKFTEGMTKYSDFKQVVTGKPITNAMMQATRTMKDPAAFIYAASKQQPKELARIAAIPDAVTQAVEIGRLEERMKKAKLVPSSPKPATKVKGDASSELPQLTIDARIAAHAKSKIMR